MTSPIPGLRFGEFQGFPALLISTPFSRAAISLSGGQVLSWTPQGFDDVLWLSPLSLRPPDAIRGGIPVCWPYFARQGQRDDAPMHGLVRTVQWQITHAQQNEDGEIVLVMAPPALPEVTINLLLSMRIGRSLEQALTTVNLGTETVRFTQALHTYFRVENAERVTVSGLDGLTYADKFDNFNEHVQHGDWQLQGDRDPGRSDRIYGNTGNRFELTDPAGQRKITLLTSGSKTLVAWNPGAEWIKTFPDLPGDGWKHYICLEAANCGDEVIELATDDSHVLQQTISCAALTSH